jgi:hypothetical protein
MLQHLPSILGHSLRAARPGLEKLIRSVQPDQGSKSS